MNCIWCVVHVEWLGIVCCLLVQVAQHFVHEVLLHETICLHVLAIMPEQHRDNTQYEMLCAAQALMTSSREHNKLLNTTYSVLSQWLSAAWCCRRPLKKVIGQSTALQQQLLWPLCVPYIDESCLQCSTANYRGGLCRQLLLHLMRLSMLMYKSGNQLSWKPMNHGSYPRVRPLCHFPKCAVLYPPSAMISPEVRSARLI